MDDHLEEPDELHPFFSDQQAPERKGEFKPSKAHRRRLRHPAPKEIEKRKEGTPYRLVFNRRNPPPGLKNWTLYCGDVIIGTWAREPKEIWDAIKPNAPDYEAPPILELLKTERTQIQDFKDLNFWAEASKHRR